MEVLVLVSCGYMWLTLAFFFYLFFFVFCMSFFTLSNISVFPNFISLIHFVITSILSSTDLVFLPLTLPSSPLSLSFSLWVLAQWCCKGDLWCVAVGSKRDVLFSGRRMSLPFLPLSRSLHRKNTTRARTNTHTDADISTPTALDKEIQTDWWRWTKWQARMQLTESQTQKEE